MDDPILLFCFTKKRDYFQEPDALFAARYNRNPVRSHTSQQCDRRHEKGLPVLAAPFHSRILFRCKAEYLSSVKQCQETGVYPAPCSVVICPVVIVAGAGSNSCDIHIESVAWIDLSDNVAVVPHRCGTYGQVSFFNFRLCNMQFTLRITVATSYVLKIVHINFICHFIILLIV